MRRSNLLRALTCVRGAVSVTKSAPAFASVFFDGKQATAYNGEIAIKAPCALDGVKGGVEFGPLHAWAESCSADEVVVERKDHAIRFKCGRSRIDLSSIRLSECTFAADESLVHEVRADDLMLALGDVAPYMGNDPAHPSRQGVTIAPSKGGLLLYATDDLTMIERRVKCSCKLAVPIRMPVGLVKALLAQRDGLESICLGESLVAAGFGVGDEMVTVYGRLGAEADAADYTRLVKTITESIGDSFLPVRSELRGVLSEVMQVLNKMGQAEVLLKIEAGKLVLSSGDSGSVSFRRSMKFKHPDIEVWVVARELLRVLDGAESFIITDQAVVTRAEGRLGMVSVAG